MSSGRSSDPSPELEVANACFDIWTGDDVQRGQREAVRTGAVERW